MNRRFWAHLAILIALTVTAPSRGAEWGDLSGTFLFDGKAPKPARLSVNKDLECCGKYLDEIVDESITVGPKGGLANVFVWLRLARNQKIDVHPDLIKAASKPVILDNIHCMFKPHALAFWVGKQPLVTTNSDPIGHAVKMDFLNNPGVNSLVPSGAKVDIKLQNPESVPMPVSCGVHPWEIAYLKVHDSPYVAVTGADGKFTIEKLPVGEWEFQVWQESSGFLAAKSGWTKGRFKLKIKPGENSLGEIKVASALLKKK